MLQFLHSTEFPVGLVVFQEEHALLQLQRIVTTKSTMTLGVFNNKEKNPYGFIIRVFCKAIYMLQSLANQLRKKPYANITKKVFKYICS